jgi:hypothetical protein
MFQDFYRKAESQISTHIAALASKISREKPSKSPKKDPGQGEQQMLTASEISDRKKARRILEQKRVALEEAVERAVCERVYFKIWHHRSAEDEEGDQKLRSRIAALSLIGIGLKELVVSGSDDVSEEVRRKAVEQEDKIRESLAAARTSIRDMSREKYPLGKLNHLTSAHKSIVETLSNFFPSSSSADEILPTLIYTLITSPPDEVNVVSDLHFIQRFRAQGKIDGEAAYCLVNLEAAVSFLETVELPTLRADEPLEGPEKSTDPSRKRDSTPMELGIAPAPNPDAQLEAFPSLTPVSSTTSLSTKPLPQARSPRRLSQLIAAQTNRLEAAGDSLRDAVLDSADHAVGAINTTLESSFRFLFGRIRASQNQASASADGVGTDIPNPKTLEDARKLVSAPSTPVLRHRLGEDAGASDPATPPSDDGARFPARAARGGARMLDLVGGRRPARDRSADSSASGGSAAPGAPGPRHVPFAGAPTSAPHAALPPAAEPRRLAGSPALSLDGSTAAPSEGAGSAAGDALASPPLPPHPPTAPAPAAAAGGGGPGVLAAPASAAVESMRSLGSSLNPLNQFAKMGLFGRAAPGPPAAAALASAPASSPLGIVGLGAGPAAGAPGRVTPPPPPPPQPRPVSAAEARTLAAVDEARAAAKPRGKFVDCRDARELRVGEVEELLAEYKRLAGLLGKVLAP